MDLYEYLWICTWKLIVMVAKLMSFACICKINPSSLNNSDWAELSLLLWAANPECFHLDNEAHRLTVSLAHGKQY